jgi:dTDP-4-dehydrorhamnose reductase
MNRLVVTGASGLLGNQIVKSARDRFEVIPLHNARPLHANSLRLDIVNSKDVSKLLVKLKPGSVIHTASETNVDKCETQREHAWKVNVDGTGNIATACQKIGARLIYISTDYVFDGERGNYKEKDMPNPINHYGYTKLEAEQQATQRCENYLILRTSVIYGWHPWKQNFATWVIDQLRQSKQIAVVEDHFNTPTLAQSLAEMTVEVVERDLQGLYHVSGSERVSRYEFARRIAMAFDLDSGLIKPIKMNQLATWVAKRPRDSSLDTGKIQKRLRAKPLNIAEGLLKMKAEEGT